ncbi:MAG: isochorismatase [Planctomycetota bacterium]|nr:MAG: isochorismatase [Planctomycetota bacterium]
MMKSKRAFLDIDTQHDFMDPDGALYVPGAGEIVGNLGRLVAYARDNNIPLLSSMDAHAGNDPEFAEFPPHCVKGTPGQRKIDETLLENTIIVPDRPGALPEGVRAGAQVIFEKPTFDVFDNPNFVEYIEREGYDEFVVFGVATDYCVRAAAAGLARRGFSVAVVTDAVRAVMLETGAKALEEMKGLGVKFKTTDEITG